MARLFKGPDELDLTSGDIARPLFFLSLPLILTNLMQTAYNLADTYWLGQYGTNELAAISFAFPMVFLFISVGLGLSIAGSILVAQHTGAGNHDRAEYAAAQTLTVTTIASALFGGLTYAAAPTLLSVFGAEPAVHPLATSYLRIISLGLVFMFGFFVFISLMRGYGNTVTPMVVMFGTVVLNIALDPFLIFGFDQNPLLAGLGLNALQSDLYALTGYAGNGIEGAAIATVFSRGLAAVVGLAILLRGNHGLRVRLSQMRPDAEFIRTMLRIGVPASIDGMGRAVSVNLMLLVVGLFPTSVVAGYGIGVRVFSVVFLPASAVEQSVETMTGQNIGAGNEGRAIRTNHFSARVMGLILTGVGVCVFLAARPLTAIFTTDAEVVTVGAEFLRCVALTFGGIGVVRSYTGGFRGVGKTMIAATISIAMLGVIRLPTAAIGVFLFDLGRQGIWYGFAASNILGAVIAVLWFRRDSWREGSVVETADASAADD